MILQYKKKEETKWKEYPGKSSIQDTPDNYHFRLLSQNKKEILAEKGTYQKILKKMKQIETLKHNKKGQKTLKIID